MNANHFNICPSCIHSNYCVLTAQKDKVWSCSEFEEIQQNGDQIDTAEQPVMELELI